MNCNNNKVEIFENSPAPVTCGDITSTADVVWRRGDGVNIGVCGADGTCRHDLYTDCRLSRSWQSRESQLTLVPDYRRHAGLTVTCQEIGGLSTATCTLVIRSHSVLSECQVTNNTVDWTVSGSCRVQQAFSSDNNYSCTWTRIDGPQTFRGFDASRELCSFTQPLPQAGGLYSYSISLSPPPATTIFSQELRLGAGNVSNVLTETDSPSSVTAVTGPVVGVIVAVVVTAIIAIFLFIFIRRQRQKLKNVPKESARYHIGIDNGCEDFHVRDRTEDVTTRTLSAANVYENTQRLAEETYETPCAPCEEHHYRDLKVKATREVKAKPRALPDREEGDGVVYSNVS